MRKTELNCDKKNLGIFSTADTLGRIAIQCVGDAKLGLAREYSLAALRRQPFNQLALAALGSISDLQSDTRRADKWFDRASALGHRDYATETYWIARNSAQHRFSSEVRHIDALFRAGWNSDEAEQQLKNLESDGAGRAALIPLTNNSSSWVWSYIGTTSTLTDSELYNRTKLLLDIGKTRTQPNYRKTVLIALPAINALYERGFYDRAYALHTSLFSNSSAGFINDPEFKHLEDKSHTPFDWASRSYGELDVSTGRDDSNRSGGLILHSSDPGRYLIAEQTIRLDAGQYLIQLFGNGSNFDKVNFVLHVKSVRTGEVHAPIFLETPARDHASEGNISIDSNDKYFRIGLWIDSTNINSSVDIVVNSLNLHAVHHGQK